MAGRAACAALVLVGWTSPAWAQETRLPFDIEGGYVGFGGLINFTLDGKTFTVYSATLRKSYKTDDGWKNTQFFRGSELFVARHLLELAEKWILDQRTEADPPF